MKTSTRLTAMTTALLCASAIASFAHAQGPLPIREETPGLLAQAPTPPAFARLTAFGAFPGAQMVAAEISMLGSRLAYSFDFKYEGRKSIEHVVIDAITGQVVCLEYSVEQQQGGQYTVVGPPELVSLVASSYGVARGKADESAGKGRVRSCRLKVQGASEIYVFDVEAGEDRGLLQVMIDANTGALISSLPPK